ncbi:MAG: hypothetical protein FJW22_09330 [Acidimicrobiia bacterium]|nr:hypothetical protein [Acidimicrobiia bacterium]
MTQAGVILGTTACMSSEQARGKFIEQRLGVRRRCHRPEFRHRNAAPPEEIDHRGATPLQWRHHG